MYAAEDIYTADFQKDDNGNRILGGSLGTAELLPRIRMERGHRSLTPLGNHKIVEKTAPEGFCVK